MHHNPNLAVPLVARALTTLRALTTVACASPLAARSTLAASSLALGTRTEIECIAPIR